jgi:hypothetical protein
MNDRIGNVINPKLHAILLTFLNGRIGASCEIVVVVLFDIRGIACKPRLPLRNRCHRFG